MTGPKALSPVLVALLRGVVYAALTGLAAGLLAITDADLGKYAWAAPAIPLVARGIEGVVDRWRGQALQLPGGSKPADPTAYAPAERPPWTLPATSAASAGAMTATINAAVPEPPVAVVVSVTQQGETVDAGALRAAIKTAMPRASDETVARVMRHVVDELAQSMVAVS
jgi:hypothetical protein